MARARGKGERRARRGNFFPEVYDIIKNERIITRASRWCSYSCLAEEIFVSFPLSSYSHCIQHSHRFSTSILTRSFTTTTTIMATSTMTVDERDRGTPDEWIVRDPTLIRLTGRHPFNAEPPTQELMKHGFLTPTSIHYVRNHGTVPSLQWESHKIEISGYAHAMRVCLSCMSIVVEDHSFHSPLSNLFYSFTPSHSFRLLCSMVEHPMTLTMDEIAALPSIKLPVTLACSGNRRKEQNMMAKSLGFHWGSGAVSTSIWRGVRLAEVLRKCGVNWPLSASSEDGSPPPVPRFVCFEGADQLPFGYYGTCIPIERAMDEYFDVLLAYEMNGERLTPDHGYPLRLVGGPQVSLTLNKEMTLQIKYCLSVQVAVLTSLPFHFLSSVFISRYYTPVDRAWMHWWTSGQMAAPHLCLGQGGIGRVRSKTSPSIFFEGPNMVMLNILSLFLFYFSLNSVV